MNIFRIKVIALQTTGRVVTFFEDVVTDSAQSALRMVEHYRTTQPAPLAVEFELFDVTEYKGRDTKWSRYVSNLELLSHPSMDTVRLRAAKMGLVVEVDASGHHRFIPMN
jgi:hypothetical protein